jgi:murein DD-endopeptidase MepM/ murein hydrolase activator NlpD
VSHSSPNTLLRISDITGTTAAARQWRRGTTEKPAPEKPPSIAAVIPASPEAGPGPVLSSLGEDYSDLIAQMHADLNRANSRELASKGTTAPSPQLAKMRDPEFVERARALFAPLSQNRIRMPVPSAGPRALAVAAAASRDGRPRRHRGIDIFAPRGAPVIAVTDGIINYIGDQPKGGLCLWLTAESGTSFYYAHLDRWAAGIYEGMEVRSGDLLGYVGNSGNAIASAPHLHFGVNVNDEMVDIDEIEDDPALYAPMIAAWRRSSENSKEQ